nr:ribonuclease H-like domain-containing protein [Tanacetum cinerariifolium]GEU81912.1 ribonuclease H-like domain-containing protein [Tanacetum cinerariifolium]
VLPPKTAEEILAREIERKARTTLLMGIPEDHLAKFHKITDAKEMWEAIKSRFGGNDESKKMVKYILKQQFEGFSVSNLEGLHKGYDRSLPSSWSQVSLIMRVKPRVDTFSFDDLYSNLRVFESDVKVSTESSSSTQNVAFVSSDSTNSTKEVSTAYGVSTSSGHKSQKEGSSSYTDDLMYSFFANQSSCLQLDHEDLEQVNKFDLEEMDLKWQVAMISTRLKKFYKKTGRNLHFDAKEPVGFDKTKVKCFNWHNTGHFTKECKSKGNQESRRRDVRNTGYKARDNGRRPAKQDEHKAMVTIDRKEAEKEKEELKPKLENFQSSSKGLSKLLNSQISTKDKYGLSRSSDVEDSHVNDRFIKVEGMHAVPPPMTEIYVPPKSDFGIDESKFTYDPKQFKTSESDVKTNNLDSCESNSSVETLESVPKTVESKRKAVSEPKVWSDAPIIEEYDSDSDDEYVFKASDNPHQTLKGKAIVDSGCSRHMTGKKAYLVEYQDFSGGPVVFGGSKGQITGKLTKLTIEERFAFNVSLRMFTRSIVIQRRMKDLQLGVESYQKKLNLTKPDTYRSDLKCKEAYTAYSNPIGFIYQNKDKQNRLMRIDKLHKFSDGTLNDVRTALDDCLKGIQMKYLPQTVWRRNDKERAAAMIQAIDKEDHAKSRKVYWGEIVRGRLQDAITDHMIYHMMSLSYKGQTRTYLSCEFINK